MLAGTFGAEKVEVGAVLRVAAAVIVQVRAGDLLADVRHQGVDGRGRVGQRAHEVEGVPLVGQRVAEQHSVARVLPGRERQAVHEAVVDLDEPVAQLALVDRQVLRARRAAGSAARRCRRPRRPVAVEAEHHQLGDQRAALTQTRRCSARARRGCRSRRSSSRRPRTGRSNAVLPGSKLTNSEV